MKRWIMVVAMGLCLGAPAAGEPVPAVPDTAIAREVIVFYNSAEKVGLRGEGSPTAVEAVLNHLGLLARFQDLQNGLPDAALAARARGVISLAEGDQAPGAAALARWLDDRRRAGQPVMLLGGLPFMAEAPSGAPVKASLWRPLLTGLGLHYEGDYMGDPARTTLAGVAPGVGFELPFSNGNLPPYVQARALAPARSLIRLQRRDTGALADVAVLGPAGAVVLGRECLFDVNPLSFRVRWRMDPFMLFGTALHTAGEPHPDTTTLTGRRVFYAHVDGDGFKNLAQSKSQPYAAEMLRDRLLVDSPLPTTVSLIARDIVGSPRASAVARSILALPTVEAASHTYNHPHDFERGTLTPEGEFSDGDRISGVRPAHPISPEREIDDSLRAIQRLLPPGKQVAAVLWSGSTNPTTPFLARTDALGVANLNGGDAFVDPVFPSIANMAPLGRRVGPYLQVYASAANENLFTNLWSGPYDGQRQVLATYAFFGAPHRLTPVDVYYHFYSGERPASLQALKEIYSWAAAQPFAYVRASRYARMVEGFYGASLARDASGAWRVDHMGACRTLRFDHEAQVPDLAASTGVAGYERVGDRLYVHLAGPAARLVLATGPAVRPYLASANAPLESWQWQPGTLRATFEAAAPCEVVLAGFPAGKPVKLSAGWRAPRAADAHGRLQVQAAAGRRSLEATW